MNPPLNPPRPTPPAAEIVQAIVLLTPHEADVRRAP